MEKLKAKLFPRIKELSILPKKESYDDMLKNLEGILNNMEKSELPLEELIKEYESGVKLINKLYKTLNSLEGKLFTIKEDMEVELDNE